VTAAFYGERRQFIHIGLTAAAAAAGGGGCAGAWQWTAGVVINTAICF